MQVGNLIRINRAMIGVPAGSLALIIKVEETPPTLIDPDGGIDVEQFSIHTVKFIGATSGRATRRLLARDLEVVSG
jgi:hypothetical protein